VNHKELDNLYLNQEKTIYSLQLPTTNTVLTFKLLTHADEQAIDQEVKGLKKLNKDSSAELSTRLKRIITSVNGDTELKLLEIL
jgi:hypothetical protein